MNNYGSTLIPDAIYQFQGHHSVGSWAEEFLIILPYMDMVAILAVWPGWFEHVFVSSNAGGSIWNLVTVGQLAFEEMYKVLKIGGS